MAEKSKGEGGAPAGPETTAAEQPKPQPVTLESVKADHPEVAETLRKEGAEAERTRILGIEAQAAGLPGHDELVTQLKADGESTPEQAATRILAAEREQRQKQMTAISDVEQTTGVVPPAPKVDKTETPASAPQTEDGWRQEFEASEALQQEFATADAYVSYKKGVASGKVHVFGGSKSA